MRYIALALLFAASLPAADDGWPAYGGDAGGTRYSPLKQVTRANVGKLKVAWTYHTGALQPETASTRRRPLKPRRFWWMARSISARLSTR